MKIYMAKKGDTLWILAEKFRVHPDTLFELNPHISNPELLDPGLKVKIPIPPSPLELPPVEFLDQYQVRQGDTLWKLSKSWNVPLKALIAVNPQLYNPNVLTAGEIVNVPKLTAAIAASSQAASEKQTPVVKINVKAAGKKEKEIQRTEPKELVVPQESPFMNDEPGWVNQPYPHEAEGFFDTEQMFWGDVNPVYTTNVSNPFETYTVDPRVNLPVYPEYETEGLQLPMEQQEEQVTEPDKTTKRTGKSKDKAKGNRKPTKAAAASLSAKVSSKRGSKPVRKSSKPWTNV